MTNSELLAKIKAEIERIYGENHDHADRWDMGFDSACEKMLDFLDTIESEKPMQEGLEEEIERYWEEEMPVVLESDLTNIARHFAKWGAEHASGSSEIPNDKVVEGEVILNGHGLLTDVTKWGDGYKLKIIIKED